MAVSSIGPTCAQSNVIPFPRAHRSFAGLMRQAALDEYEGALDTLDYTLLHLRALQAQQDVRHYEICMKIRLRARIDGKDPSYIERIKRACERAAYQPARTKGEAKTRRLAIGPAWLRLHPDWLAAIEADEARLKGRRAGR